MNSLHLHIDRIVVDGLSEREQHRFKRVLAARLDTFARSGIADQFASSQRITIPALPGTLPPGATAEQAAARVIHSLRRSIAPGPRANQVRAGEAPAATRPVAPSPAAAKPAAARPSAGEARRNV